ncbi:28816_t:CDS:2, partial [Racocetra persica]
PIPLPQNSATDQILIQNHVPVDDLILLDDISLSLIQNMPSNNLPQNDTEWFDNIEDKYNISTDEKCLELAGTLLYDYSKRNIIKIEDNFGDNPIKKNYRLTSKELIFEECKSNSDPLRPYQNLIMMTILGYC